MVEDFSQIRRPDLRPFRRRRDRPGRSELQFLDRSDLPRHRDRRNADGHQWRPDRRDRAHGRLSVVDLDALERRHGRHDRGRSGRLDELADDESRRGRLRRRVRRRPGRHDGRAHRHQRRLSLERDVLAAARHLDQHAGGLRRGQSCRLRPGRLRDPDGAEAIRTSCT